MTKGKFASNRDEILYHICNEGWANESLGDNEAPTGYFWRVTIDPEDRAEIVDAFNSEMVVKSVMFSALVGHWLCQEDRDGFFTVQKMETGRELIDAYRKLEGQYCEWSKEDKDA
jgi:hypothetical protein